MYFGPDARLSYILLWVTSGSLGSILKGCGNPLGSCASGLWLPAFPKRPETPKLRTACGHNAQPGVRPACLSAAQEWLADASSHSTL